MSELQGLQRHVEEIREAGGEVVAVSVDPVETTRETLGSAGFTFTLLADPELAVIDAYGVRHPGGGMEGTDIARPATFLIDREGRIVWRDLTDNWRVRVRPGRLVERLAAMP